MKATIKHNKEIIHLEKEDCTEFELISNAIEKMNMFYKDHVNEIQIGDKILKFKVWLDRV